MFPIIYASVAPHGISANTKHLSQNLSVLGLQLTWFPGDDQLLKVTKFINLK